MNRYLEKVAELFSDENKQVGKTFATQTVANIPAHLIGGAAGGVLGAKYLSRFAGKMNRQIGRGAASIGTLGQAGRFVSKYIRKGKGMDGKALGVGLGMSAVGGLADLAALKHGFHSHGKAKKE